MLFLNIFISFKTNLWNRFAIARPDLRFFIRCLTISIYLRFPFKFQDRTLANGQQNYLARRSTTIDLQLLIIYTTFKRAWSHKIQQVTDSENVA